jgi:nucleotide-binding universal stress UspA family protein
MSLARQVRVVTVLNDKPDAQSGLGDDAVRHLKAHGVNALADEIDGKGRKIGEVLESYVQEQNSDLLVMGAYGHSRFREFVLGGATAHLMRDPKFPLFLSH